MRKSVILVALFVLLFLVGCSPKVADIPDTLVYEGIVIDIRYNDQFNLVEKKVVTFQDGMKVVFQGSLFIKNKDGEEISGFPMYLPYKGKLYWNVQKYGKYTLNMETSMGEN